MTAMKRKMPPVLGVRAAPPRPTLAGTIWLACLIALPVFIVLMVVEWIVRWLI
ncbi:hypothetical protein [Meridianimarinicoccus aquatilis]|uniref:hypothetical protein n=1 Tax=Meridianimarinicoccus aquatilis TaxID=2552766 RepID=UPI0014046007|nr:hypothetical protein [Fluviibacterium aquatile]